MLLTILNVVYVLVAIAMIALILMQRGAGAQAGSGFGAGASATVFGSRGAGNFLSKSTKWLAIVFFAMTLGMAVYAVKSARKGPGPAQQDLGLMSQAPATPAGNNAAVPAAPAGNSAVPAAPAPASAVLAAPAPATQQPAAANQPQQSQPQQPTQGR